ncbi:hypothetical protein BCON_0141g00040 [Botryotinia convoluta]|uniref:2EXR domain-containing protein n=1 Tax=Botryotinia convoluta TaxID=54673 RepID=A0A4Z1I655_9HELO|nr:hypothetical protein BCON_0141g00040 [Botryotinia convoluta]
MARNWMSTILKLLPSWVMRLFTFGTASKDLVDTQEVTNFETYDSDENPPVVNQSSFLRLPLELRNRIYKELCPDLGSNPKIFLLLNRGPVERHTEKAKEAIVKRFRKDGRRCYPEILRLNRQFHHEAIPLWDRQTNKSLANEPCMQIKPNNISTVRWTSVPENRYIDAL